MNYQLKEPNPYGWLCFFSLASVWKRGSGQLLCELRVRPSLYLLTSHCP